MWNSQKAFDMRKPTLNPSPRLEVKKGEKAKKEIIIKREEQLNKGKEKNYIK
jgi:hypothetical protein